MNDCPMCDQPQGVCSCQGRKPKPDKNVQRIRARFALESWAKEPLARRRGYSFNSAIRIAQNAGISEREIDAILSGTQVTSD